MVKGATGSCGNGASLQAGKFNSLGLGEEERLGKKRHGLATLMEPNNVLPCGSLANVGAESIKHFEK